METYLARCHALERAAFEARVRSAAAELTRGGTPVSFDGTIHVPEDETCFFVIGAESEADAALLARRAGLDPVRIVEAVASGKE